MLRIKDDIFISSRNTDIQRNTDITNRLRYCHEKDKKIFVTDMNSPNASTPKSFRSRIVFAKYASPTN